MDTRTEPAADRALLSFQLGPVQTFIGAARTVRDLWTGSYLLSWLTFAALKSVHATPGVTILSPHLEKNPLLWTVKREGSSPAGITTPCLPNRFIAQLPSGVDSARLAASVEKACLDEWRRVCQRVHEAIADLMGERNSLFTAATVNGRTVNLLASPWDRLWLSQIESFFEVRTAVLLPGQLTRELKAALLDPVPESDRQAEMEVLAGLADARKAVRHVPPYRPAGDVPQKCTLLGTYEQMGPAHLDESREFWKVFAEQVHLDGTRVREGERLCAVSLVKRFAWPAYLAGQVRQRVHDLRYSDTATVAAFCWLPTVEEAPEEDLDWTRLRRWSGQWLHWHKPDQDAEEPCRSEMVWKWLQRRKRERGRPPAYYGILMADADNLGSLLAQKGADVSRALTAFALNAVEAVIAEHRGELIYSGGDDTLGLIPAEQALACAGQLRDRFTDNWRKHFPDDPDPATLSAGLAVVHYKEDLRFALDVAREAEGVAKRSGRNALAIAVCRRSGEHTTAVLGWDQVPLLAALVELFITGAGARGVSDRWTYRLRATLPTLQGLPWEAFTSEVTRLLGRLDGVTREQREAMTSRVKTFLSEYHREMNSNRRREEKDIMADFVTLCQSASFLARGRDGR